MELFGPAVLPCRYFSPATSNLEIRARGLKVCQIDCFFEIFDTRGRGTVTNTSVLRRISPAFAAQIDGIAMTWSGFELFGRQALQSLRQKITRKELGAFRVIVLLNDE